MGDTTFLRKKGYNRITLRNGTRFYVKFTQYVMTLIAHELKRSLQETGNPDQYEYIIELDMLLRPPWKRNDKKQKLGDYKVLKVKYGTPPVDFLIHRIRLFPFRMAHWAGTIEEFRVMLAEALVHEVGHLCYAVATDHTGQSYDHEAFAEWYTHAGSHNFKIFLWLRAIETKEVAPASDT